MIAVGSTVGNYEVLRKVGQGQMGAVYMARHPSIGKRVALKVIHPELAANEEMISRFFSCLLSAASLSNGALRFRAREVATEAVFSVAVLGTRAMVGAGTAPLALVAVYPAV